MHIPDGFLSPAVCAGTGVVSAAAVGAALRRIPADREGPFGPRMGLAAAYIFAAQMVNLPVAPGVSGHLLGSVLAAVLLGPSAATVVMAAVFLSQAFFFLDGGHAALGANVLNMGLVGTCGGWVLYRAAAGSSHPARPSARWRVLGAAGAAAWIAVIAGAALTAAELALSGTIPARTGFPTIVGIHVLIGAGEAAITIGALSLLWRVRPDLILGGGGGIGIGRVPASPRPCVPASPARRWLVAAAGLAGIALLAPLASRFPDGLEWAARRLRFEAHAASPALPGLMPDYATPGLLPSPWTAVLVSLVGGTVLLAGLWLLVKARRVGGPPKPPSLPQPNARVRLFAAMVLSLSAALLPSGRPERVLLLTVIAAAWVLAARVPARWLARRTLVVLPFLSLGAIALLHGGDGFTPGRFGLALLRALTSLLATAAFLVATPESEVLAAMDALRLPHSLGLTMAFSLRYLQTLSDEARRMLQARAVRGGGGGTMALRALGTGGIAGSLFIRSLERSERVSQAMAARGYCGLRPSRQPLTAFDLAFGVVAAALALGVWLWP